MNFPVRVILTAWLVVPCIAQAAIEDGVDIAASPSAPADFEIEVSAFNNNAFKVQCDVTLKANYRQPGDQAEVRYNFLRTQITMPAGAPLEEPKLVGFQELLDLGIPGMKYVSATVERKQCKQIFDVAENPRTIQLTHASYMGTSCWDNNRPMTVPSDDQRALGFLFDSVYVADVGPGSAPSAGRKSCNMKLDLNIPRGWQYAVDRIKVKGSAMMSANTKVDFVTNIGFSTDQTAQISRLLNGPYEGDFIWDFAIAPADLRWSSCTTANPISIASSLRALRTSGNPMDAFATLAIENIEIASVAWRMCE